ncbi:MAG TPA: VWA domain-containing protein [Bryobacteraceae bacterium]|jgi:VWFA-related protein|nr:VWA domain-containing protein [Bryobacteraceae bacterium]
MIARLICCLLLYSIVLSAQQPEIASTQAPVTFSSGVNVVSVPVVVRDSKGRALGNLSREDFRLLDQGKQQVITKFSVQRNAVADQLTVETGARATTDTPTGTARKILPDHYVAYMFDDVDLTPADLVHVHKAAEAHLAKLPSGSRAAIFTTSGRVAVDFTEDRDKLNEGLARIAASPSAAPLPGSSECPDVIGVALADRVLNAQDPEASQEAYALLTLCLPPAAITRGTIESFAEKALAVNHLNTAATVSSLADVVRRLSLMPGNRLLVLASPGFMVLGDLRAQQSDAIEKAIRSNIIISTLDARGLFTAWLNDTASEHDGINSIRMRSRREEAQANSFVLADLADGTGGKFFHNDNGLAEGFDELAAPPEYVYTLGFSPQNLKLDGRYHELKVRLVTAKGLEVQARRGYWAPNHAADPAEQSKEEIHEAVFSLDEVRDIPVDVTTEFFKTGDITAQLTVTSKLDLRAVKFRSSGDRNTDTITVVTGLFDQDGHYVKGLERVIDLRLRDQTLEKLTSTGLPVQETFDLTPGRYVVRVVVRDSEGSAMAARNGTVNIP